MSSNKTKESTAVKLQQAKAKKRRENQKRNEQILKKRKMMLAGVVAVIAVILVIAVLFAKGTFEKKADENTLTLNSDGSVVFEEVLKTGDYKSSDVKKFVKEQIATYKDSKQADIRLERYAANKDRIYVRIRYGSAADYASCTGYWLTTGSVKNALDNDMEFDGAFVKVENGAKGDGVVTSKVTDKTKLKLLTIRENTKVVIPGKVKFITDENTTMDGVDTVKIASADSNEDATAITYIVYE